MHPHVFCIQRTKVAAKLDDIKVLADALTEKITNEEKVHSGKTKTVRFSPQTLSVAMSVYQRSQKAYSELRDRDNSTIWPSLSHLATLRSGRRHNSGECCDQYVDARETFFSEGGVEAEAHGILVCDECKIVGNLVFNAYTHEIEGTTDDGNDLDTLTDLLFDNEDNGENASKNIATYVNLWKYRQVGGGKHFSFLGEHYFNSGALNAFTLLSQFYRVLLNCEMQGFRVHALCCDAGTYATTMIRTSSPSLSYSYLYTCNYIYLL